MTSLARPDRGTIRIAAFEAALVRWLATYSVDLLRVSLGLVFFGFGILKFVPGLSPAEPLATARRAQFP